MRHRLLAAGATLYIDSDGKLNQFFFSKMMEVTGIKHQPDGHELDPDSNRDHNILFKLKSL